MKEEELKRLIGYTVIFAITNWVIIILSLDIDLISFDSLQHFGTAISGVTLFWIFYFRWGWKWAPFKFLFYRPDLNGTWIGCFQTDWRDDKGRGVPIGEIALTIRQNFLFIHLTSFTVRHVAYSYAETLILDTDRGIHKIIYLYSQSRTNPGTEGDRQGATELDIFGEAPLELVGNFWTNAKSIGFLKVRRVSKYHTTSFAEAKKRWPIQQDWETIK